MTAHTLGWTAYGLSMVTLVVAIWRQAAEYDRAEQRLETFKQRANRHQKRDP